jgi:hypothetical protein
MSSARGISNILLLADKELEQYQIEHRPVLVGAAVVGSRYANNESRW